MERTFYLRLLENLHHLACSQAVTVMSKRLWLLQVMTDAATVNATFTKALDGLRTSYNLLLDKDVDYVAWSERTIWEDFYRALEGKAIERYNNNGKLISYDIVSLATKYLPSPTPADEFKALKNDIADYKGVMDRKKNREDYRRLLVDLDRTDFVSDQDVKEAARNAVEDLRGTLANVAVALEDKTNAYEKRKELYYYYRRQYIPESPFPTYAHTMYKRWEDGCYEPVTDELQKEFVMSKLVILLKSGFVVLDPDHVSPSYNKKYAKELGELLDDEENKAKLVSSYAQLRALLIYKDGLFEIKNTETIGRYLYNNRHKITDAQIKLFYIFIDLNEIIMGENGLVVDDGSGEEYSLKNLPDDLQAYILLPKKYSKLAALLNHEIKNYVISTGNKANWDAVHFCCKHFGMFGKNLSREKFAKLITRIVPGLGEAKALESSMEKSGVNWPKKKAFDYDSAEASVKRALQPIWNYFLDL